jgi:hypothetical protein
MCAFCAAIPVAGALGAKARSKQKEQVEQARAAGQPARQPRPIGKITAIVIVGLAAGSFLYHTHTGLMI